MAGNFWQSSHYQQWLLTKDDLVRDRRYDLQFLTPEEYQKLNIFFANLIQVLGEQFKLRQQVIHCICFKINKIFITNLLTTPGHRNSNSLLQAVLCAKFIPKHWSIVDGTNMHFSSIKSWRIRRNIQFAPHFNGNLHNLFRWKFPNIYEYFIRPNPPQCQNVMKNKFSYAYQQEFPYRTNHILECEFYLLENLDCCLIVYQPYRPLLPIIQDIGHEDQLLPLTWRIINDSLRTDVSLLYAPYMIAIGCLQLAWFVLLTNNLHHFS